MKILLSSFVVLAAASMAQAAVIMPAEQSPSTAVVAQPTTTYAAQQPVQTEQLPNSAALAPAPAATSPGSVAEAAPVQLAPAPQPMYAAPAPQPTVAPAPIAQTNVVPTYTVQQQPVTIIQASPLEDSRLQQLKQKVKQAEINTNDQVVEKLEESRLQDEQSRLQRLFGNDADQQQTQPVVAAPSSTALQDNSAAAVALPAQTSVAKDDDVKKSAGTQMYASAFAGIASYPKAVNVKGNSTLGVSIGELFPERYSVEGFFAYSNYEVNDVANYGYDYSSWIKSVDQYNIGAAAKYDIFSSRFTPVVGAMVSYTYRTYTDKNSYFMSSQDSTQAIDLGPIIGAEFNISRKLAVGVDYRYFFNLMNPTNAGDNQSFIYGSSFKPLEQISYDMWTVNARFLF